MGKTPSCIDNQGGLWELEPVWLSMFGSYITSAFSLSVKHSATQFRVWVQRFHYCNNESILNKDDCLKKWPSLSQYWISTTIHSVKWEVTSGSMPLQHRTAALAVSVCWCVCVLHYITDTHWTPLHYNNSTQRKESKEAKNIRSPFLWKILQ